MFRKLLIAAVAALGLTVPMISEAQAHDRRRDDHDRRHHDRCYRVYFRRDCHERWHCYGTYDCYRSASRIVGHLRDRGYDAYAR